VNPTGSRSCSNTIASGLVITTVPVAGSLVTSGEVVKLVLSSGYCPVVVPTVINDTQSAATAALQQQGLLASFSFDPTNICTPGNLTHRRDPERFARHVGDLRLHGGPSSV